MEGSKERRRVEERKEERREEREEERRERREEREEEKMEMREERDRMTGEVRGGEGQGGERRAIDGGVWGWTEMSKEGKERLVSPQEK